jgi:predicted MFS family arabinose efflux permease
MTAGLVLFAGGAAVTAATGLYGVALVGFALMGLGKPTFDVSAQAYVAERTPYRLRARYLAVLELTWAGGLLVGAPLTGWLIHRFGWASPFWLLAGAGAAALVVVPRFLDPDPVRRRRSDAPLRVHRSSLALLAAVTLLTLASELVFVVFGAWLEDEFGLTLIGLGGAAVVIGLAELAGEGATALLTDRMGKRRAVATGLVVSAAGFGMLALAPSSLPAGLGLLAFALLGFEFTVVSAIPLASESQPTARARFLALLVVAMSLGRTTGAAAGPFLFTAAGLTGVAVAAVLFDLAALAVLIGWVREEPETSPL